eukprot:758776-Hanusia_phi.AAC.2
MSQVAMGTSRSTFASDAWALGCVLFQLLAGHVPIVSSLDRHLEVVSSAMRGRAASGREGPEMREVMCCPQHEDGIEGNKKKLHRIVQFSETFGATGPSALTFNR